MPLYFSDYALINVQTGSTAVHLLPYGLTVVTGISAPAAATGTKNLSAVARICTRSLGRVDILKNLDGILQISMKPYFIDVHVSPVKLDGVLQIRMTTPRGEVSTISGSDPAPWMTYMLVTGANLNVWTDALLKNRLTPSCDLTVQGGKNLDGLLTNKVSLTGDLRVVAGTYVDGTLPIKVTATCSLDVTAAGRADLDGTLRFRSVGNATLSIGTTHMPSGLLQMKWTANAILTINYMQAMLRMRWTPSCVLRVEHRFAASAGMKQTATCVLTRTPNTGGGLASMHWTGSAKLNTPLRVSTGCKWSASAGVSIGRRLAASAQARSTASMNLSVVRTFGASLGVRQTATATLVSVRALAAQAAMRSSASATLSVARYLSGFAPIRWTAVLDLQPTRPVKPPETDITVSPYTSVVDSEVLPVQVESPEDAVDVEEA